MSKLLLVTLKKMAVPAFALLTVTVASVHADTEDTLRTDSAFRLMIDRHVSETMYSEAALQDLRLIAEARGWSLADAKAQRKVTAMLGKTGRKIRKIVGDRYLGSRLSTNPGQMPTIYLSGDIPESVRDAAPEGVQIQGDGKYTLSELEARQKRLHNILINFGHKEIATDIDIQNGTINATVLRVEDPRLDISVEGLAYRLPESLQSDVSVTVERDSFVSLDASFGGIDIRSSPDANGRVGKCTTGWVVKDSSGNTGVTTAGHCSAMAEIEHWGGRVHDITLEGSHFGRNGDISWYSTGTQDLAYFYFNHLNQVREVKAVKAVRDMVIGEPVCVYGGASNLRDCSANIVSTSASCTYEGVGTVKNMISMSKYLTMGGDSGGGWSYENTAFGSTTGSCDSKSIFSPADRYNKAIGVTVLTR